MVAESIAQGCHYWLGVDWCQTTSTSGMQPYCSSYGGVTAQSFCLKAVSGGGPLAYKYGPISIPNASQLSLINAMATLVLVLNLCRLPREALAAPIEDPTQNLTALRTEIAPPWVPDPDNRGTWSLLYSCTFTLVLCVWTAIHLNVPSYHESQISRWLRKLKWVLLAIIAPELGVYTAFEQYFQVKELIGELAEASVRKGSQGCYRTNQSENEKSKKVWQPVKSVPTY